VIHNTFLVKVSTKDILASSQYWPIDVPKEKLDEYLSTREEIRIEHGSLDEIPLIIDDMKFVGADCGADQLLIFAGDKGEDEHILRERLFEAVGVLKENIRDRGLSFTQGYYESLIETSITTRLKIALVGEGGVGKTTTLHLLLGDTPPLQYVPTIALNLETVENIRFGNYSLVLWDFAGQERFRTLWRFYFHGADVIFLVCDSTLRNVIISKDILKMIKRDAPKVPVFAIANKQDKPNAMKPEVVQKILGVPTYPMVAIDKSRRDEMLRILMTAAAQFIGVTLPDVAPAEILRFAEEVKIPAKLEVPVEKVVEEIPEVEEIIEEVLVDEEGHVIENLEGYEVIEEFVEEIDGDTGPTIEEVATEIGVAETKEQGEIISIPVIEEPSKEEIGIEIEEELEITEEPSIEEAEVEVVVEPEIEKAGPVYLEFIPMEEKIEIMEKPSIEEAEVEVVVEPEIEKAGPVYLEFIPIEEKATEMVKEIISEALDADELITAEIDKVSREALDEALEAFSCDEALPIEGEADSPETVEAETVKELEEILGTLDRIDDVIGGSAIKPDDQKIESDAGARMLRTIKLTQDAKSSEKETEEDESKKAKRKVMMKLMKSKEEQSIKSAVESEEETDTKES
jgi:small GTP-binding protein